jgi:hypothetical protein
MNQQQKPLFMAVGIIVIFLVGFYIYTQGQISSKPWSVVYMNTGRLYIGKVTTFPSMQLHQAYSVEKGSDPSNVQKETVQLVPLSDATWAPQKLYINKDQVIFWGPIEENSVAAKAIKGK